MKTPVPEWAVPGSAHRAARPTNCESCGRYVLRGLNRDKGGIAVDCDPEPLSPLGEALALLAGFITYESQWFGGQHTISWRDRYAIASHQAGDGIDALIGHHCDRPELAGDFPRMRSVHSYRSVTAPLPDEPPF
jgi:hypothetical protein